MRRISFALVGLVILTAAPLPAVAGQRDTSVVHDCDRLLPASEFVACARHCLQERGPGTVCVPDGWLRPSTSAAPGLPSGCTTARLGQACAFACSEGQRVLVEGEVTLSPDLVNHVTVVGTCGGSVATCSDSAFFPEYASCSARGEPGLGGTGLCAVEAVAAGVATCWAA